MSPVGYCSKAVRELVESTYYDFRYVITYLFIGDWDVLRVTNMDGIFQNASWFNQDISLWDVSRVTSMQRMFYGAKSFNQDLSWWDVSRVVDMQRMFYDASSFNRTLCGYAWANSEAHDTQMFDGSPGSISSKGACAFGGVNKAKAGWGARLWRCNHVYQFY